MCGRPHLTLPLSASDRLIIVYLDFEISNVVSLLYVLHSLLAKENIRIQYKVNTGLFNIAFGALHYLTQIQQLV